MLMGIYHIFKIKLFQFLHGKFIMLQLTSHPVYSKSAHILKVNLYTKAEPSSPFSD